MNSNTLSNQGAEYKQGNLPAALYPNRLRRAADGSDAYYARPIIRGTCTLKDLADDLVAAGVVGDLSRGAILRVARAINTAKMSRLMDGFIVDDEVCRASASITGTFASENDAFSAERHGIDLCVAATAKAKEQLARLQVVIRQGNSIHPHIASILDLESRGCDRLTPGGFLDITGSNISIVGTGSGVGLYFENTADETKTVCLPAAKLGINKPKHIACVIPATLEAGAYRIKVVTQFSRGNAMRRQPQECTFDKELIVA